MGCGASTFNRDEAGGAGGISYLDMNPLHRDSPWRRKGDRPAVDSNPSSKKLLVDAAADEDGGDSVGRKSVSSIPVSVKDNSCFMKEPPVQTMKENIPLTKEVKEERPVGGNDDDRRVIVGEDQDYANETSDKEDDIFFPRSPSFRYYCMPRDNDDSSSSSSDEMNAYINEGDYARNRTIVDENAGKSDSVFTRVESNKSRKDQDGGEAASAKLSSSQASAPSRKSRKSAAQRLRVVLPKGNPATGMKNLLNVTSCSPRRAAQAAS